MERYGADHQHSIACRNRNTDTRRVRQGIERNTGTTRSRTTEIVMAKGEQRGNREAKKPKKEKPKAPEAASPFANAVKGSASGKPSGGKR
jgi:hypothetical protein